MSTQIYKILEDFKKDIHSNTLILGDFNTPQSKMDRSSKQNINEVIAALNNALDLSHQKAKYTFFQMHMEHFQR